MNKLQQIKNKNIQHLIQFFIKLYPKLSLQYLHNIITQEFNEYTNYFQLDDFNNDSWKIYGILNVIELIKLQLKQ
jgi:hypothetical protein